MKKNCLILFCVIFFSVACSSHTQRASPKPELTYCIEDKTTRTVVMGGVYSVGLWGAIEYPDQAKYLLPAILFFKLIGLFFEEDGCKLS